MRRWEYHPSQFPPLYVRKPFPDGHRSPKPAAQSARFGAVFESLVSADRIPPGYQ
ncbi:hypothetical protein EVA_20416 [gut metagenome]|uniref:Uncharacterized protein n=1 Tax=gut metagenome TaxID=749906 RepID=J9F989_9ZZZZ